MAAATLCKFCATPIGQRELCPDCLTHQSLVLPKALPRPAKIPRTRPVGARRRLRRLRRFANVMPLISLTSLLAKGVAPSLIAHAAGLLLAAFVIFTPQEFQRPEPLKVLRKHPNPALFERMSQQIEHQPSELANRDSDEFRPDQPVPQVSLDTPQNPDELPARFQQGDVGLGPQGQTGIESATNLGLRSRSRTPRERGGAPAQSGDGNATPVSAIGHRSGEDRKAAAERHGGGEALDAVDKALAWLASVQMPDGSWDTTGDRLKAVTGKSFPSGGTTSRYDIGTSALSLLCFLGAGHTEISGKHAEVVKRGLRWLEGQQNSDGSFGERNNLAYNSGVAALAVAEAYALTKTPRHKRAATRAISFWQRSQNANGGWSYDSGRNRYEASDRSDGSISGWVVLAMKTAKLGNLPVNKRVWERSEQCFNMLSDPATGETIYADLPVFAGRRGIGMVGVGLACRRMLNSEEFAAIDTLAAQRLLEHVPNWDDLKASHQNTRTANFNSLYGWYYSSLGMFFATGGKGEAWDRWNYALKRALLLNQSIAEGEAGSWAPVETWLGPQMGRVYSTAMACLTLEVYNRHDPLEEYQLPAYRVASAPRTK